MSDARINAASAQAYGQLLQGSVLVESETTRDYVDVVMQRLIAAVDGYFQETGYAGVSGTFAWEYHVIVNDQVNAACFPGGKIVINSGLLDVVECPDELAAVLGHEMAHAIANHVAERIADEQMTGLLGQMVANSGSSQSQAASDIFGAMAKVGFLKPFNRFQESEADHIGLIIMAMAGFQPSAAVDFWKKARERGNGQRFSLNSTHPADETRMKQLTALLETVDPIYRKAKSMGR